LSKLKWGRYKLKLHPRHWIFLRTIQLIYGKLKGILKRTRKKGRRIMNNLKKRMIRSMLVASGIVQE